MEETLKQIEDLLSSYLLEDYPSIRSKKIVGAFGRKMVEWIEKSSVKIKFRENFGENWSLIDELMRN